MATGRPTNEFRLLRTLYEAGSKLSHRYLRRQLNLSDDSYDRLRHNLLGNKLVSGAEEGGYGLSLTQAGRQKFESEYQGTGYVTREEELYEPLCDLLRQNCSDGDEILNVGSLKRRGTWKNTDVLQVRVRPGVLGRGTLVRLISYEVKRWDVAWSPANVFESASHAGFCHESYLVLEWATDITFSHAYLDAYGGSILKECRRFGVGLLVLNPQGKEWQLERVLLASDTHPNEFEAHEYLSYVMSRRRFKDASERLRRLAGDELVDDVAEDDDME